MPLITAGSAGSSVLLLLAKKLPVHHDEQLLAVFPKSCVAPDGLDHVKGGLVIVTRDRDVAEQSGQGARFQFQGSLKLWDLGRNRQRAAILPLRYRGLACTNSTTECGERQPALRPGLCENPAELLSAHSGRHGSSFLLPRDGCPEYRLLPLLGVSLGSYSMLYDSYVILYDRPTRSIPSGA